MTSRALLLAPLCLLVASAGCGTTGGDKPGSLRAAPGLPSLAVYRIDVMQGNIVTPDMLAALQPGMSRERVRVVMGTPMLADPFHPDRWDYLYSERSGYQLREQRVISVHFADDRLDHVAGDVLPSPGSRYRQLLAANTRTTINVPPGPPPPRGLLERVGRRVGLIDPPPPKGYDLDSFVATDESGQYRAVTGTEGLGPSADDAPVFVPGEKAERRPTDGREAEGENSAGAEPGLFDGLLDRIGL